MRYIPMKSQEMPTDKPDQSATAALRFPRVDILVIAGYLVLTVLMTWPTILHLTDGIPGDGFDGWQNLWNLWWVKEALLVLRASPFFTDYLYPPTGANLLFHTLNIFNGLWTLPLQLNFGPAIAYNGVVFLSFVFAGYGGYLLSRYTLTQLRLVDTHGGHLPAFVGGFIFTMSPFHMAHLLGHMQVFSMIWPPFYVLWLLRALQPWADMPRSSWRSAGLACLTLILATLVDWYHTLYLLIFTGIVLVWVLLRQWLLLRARRRATTTGRKMHPSLPHSSYALRIASPIFRMSGLDHPLLGPIWLVLAIGLGFGIVVSPLLIPMIREANARPDLQTGLAQNITLSADLLAFAIPSELHPIWGAWATGIADQFSSTTSERLIFAGFVPLALSLFIIIRGWRQRIIKFWTLVLAVFFVLALGPFLHVGGSVVSLGNWPIPMPYLLFYHTIPFIGLTRSLSRYDLMVMLSLGLLTAIALAHLQFQITKSKSPSKTPHAPHPTPPRSHLPYPISLLTLLLICFEFLPLPYPVSIIDTPRFFFDIGQQAQAYTMAELPMNWDRPTPLLHQVTHGKRLLTAYTSRNNPLELAWRTPVFQHWRYLGPDIIDQPLPEIAPTIFYDFNLRYIVLDYWQMPPGPERDATEYWVSAALPGLSPVYDDGRLKVYQTPPKQATEPYLTLGNGWSDRQQNEAGIRRGVRRSFVATAAEPPELFLHHPQKQPLVLEVTAGTAVPQTLTIFADGEAVGQLGVTSALELHEVELPPLAREIVKLRFRSNDPASPVSVTRLGLRKGSSP
jgi:hypothetical protein